jgi:hypothetical protein
MDGQSANVDSVINELDWSVPAMAGSGRSAFAWKR